MHHHERSLFTGNIVDAIRDMFFPGQQRVSRNQMKHFLRKVGGFHIRKTGSKETMECGAGKETEYTIYWTLTSKPAGRGITPWDALEDLINNNKPGRYHLMAGLYENGHLSD